MEGKEGFGARVLRATRKAIDKITPEQLKKADLNPHEGRLRGSQMPRRFMNIPDRPPTEYKTPPKPEE